MKSLTIIGCGTVGRVLGRLFHQANLFEIGDILNRSLASAREAAAFIGAGRPLSGPDGLGVADVFLIAASDDAIAACAASLAEWGLVRPGTIVWHLSGALPSAVLQPVRDSGATAASVHPVKSFADPAASVASFAGTWCGIEGDGPAVALLDEALCAIGGRTFPVDPAYKSIYHAGAVLTCNYLTALIETGVRAYGRGGLPRETALQVMEPLVRGTLDNIFRAGTEQALTGPIARGDAATVSGQLAALDAWDGEIAQIYRLLGRAALDLARRRGSAPEAGLAAIEALLLGGSGD